MTPPALPKQRLGKPVSSDFGACIQSQPTNTHPQNAPRRSNPFPFTFSSTRAPRQSMPMSFGRTSGWSSDESEESEEAWTNEELVVEGGEQMEGIEAAGGNGRGVPSAATRASKILRDFKRLPMAKEPTEDLVAFKSTYASSLAKSEQILSLMGEKNRDALASQMIEYEARKSKMVDILEDEKRKLVGDVAAAEYKKAADLIAHLDALASQAVQNRQQTRRDLEQIRTNTSARLESLKKQYEARAKEFEMVMGDLSAKTGQAGASGAKGKGRERK